MGTRLAPRPVVLGLAVAGLCGLLAPRVEAATCTYGSSGETSVQGYIDETTAGVLASACVADDQVWTAVSSPAEVRLVFEFAGYAMKNEFGIYDPTDSSQMLRVFAGADAAFSQKTLTVSPSSGSFLFSLGPGQQATFSSDQVGFYLKTPYHTFFSETAENWDGFDHMVTIKLPTANTYLLGWEDLAHGGDKDFNDMGIVVAGMAPVPLPAAAWLLLSGLVGVASVARRRRPAQPA